jgi:LysM repeat protein
MIGGITREVELPLDGKPGSLAYSFDVVEKISSKDSLVVGIDTQLFEGSVALQDVMEHASFKGEISVSWEIDANANPEDIPDLDAIFGDSTPGPDNLTVNLKTSIQDLDSQDMFGEALMNVMDGKPIEGVKAVDLTRMDTVEGGVELSIDNPTGTCSDAINALLGGDISKAMNIADENMEFTVFSQNVERSGYYLQPEAKFEALKGIEVKASLIREVGVDNVTRREEDVIGGGQVLPTPTPTPVTQTSGTTDKEQMVVVPQDGLTLRDAPGGERQTVFYHGTFLEPTGQTQTDENGHEWVEVNGLDVNDNMTTGWVDSEYITTHPEGAMNDEARINPEPESQGYRTYRVENGDTLWAIAQAEGVDFEELVALNSEHLIDPSMVFEGDVVYLPATEEQAAS